MARLCYQYVFTLLIGVSLLAYLLIAVRIDLAEILDAQERMSEEQRRILHASSYVRKGIDEPKSSFPDGIVEDNFLSKIERGKRLGANRTLVLPTKGRPGSRNSFITSKFYGIVAGGGLGNQLFELTSLLGIASSVGRSPFLAANEPVLIGTLANSILTRFPAILRQFKIKLIEPFFLQRVALNQFACCRYDNISKLQQSASSPYIYLDGIYFQSYKYFHHIRKDVRDWLTPHWLAMKRAELMLAHDVRNTFHVCTHVRRGDFVSDGLHLPSDAGFTRHATEYLVRKYSTSGNISVVVLGNDPRWAELVFADKIHSKSGGKWDYQLVLTPTLSPEIDLAFSRQFCDVLLITAPSSTFGWWLSYLAKETADVYYRDITQTNDRVLNELNPDDFFPPEWTKLRTGQDNTIYESQSLLENLLKI